MEKAGAAIFSTEELTGMAMHPADKAVDAINAGEVEKAKAICAQNVNSHLFVHDSILLAWNAQTLAHVYREYGLEELRQSLRESMPPWLRPLVEMFRNGVTREAVSHLAQIWRMNCGKFSRVDEDSHTITFRIELCGCGGRLVQEGHYAESAPKPLPLIRDPAPLTGDQADFPLFCTLCRMVETLMIEWLGYPAFVLDCAPEKGEPTILTIFKDPKEVPEEYFSRVGKFREEKRLTAAPSVGGGRIFTEDERSRLPLPWMTQAIAAIDAGDVELAKGFLLMSKYEWNPVHDFGVNLAAGIFSYFYKKYGVEKLYGFGWETYNNIIMAPYFDAIRDMDVRSIVEGWAVNWHNHATKFRLLEDDEKVTFILEPCGSGGRLINEGAYDAPKGLARVKEIHKVAFNRKDFPIYCIHTSITNELALQTKDCKHPFLWDTSKLGTPGDCCIMHVYKNRESIPEQLYKEVGLEKPPRS